MRVHLIKKETVRHYIKNNARTKNSIEDWIEKIKYANWIYPNDIKSTFNSVDFLGNGSDRVVFNIGGNNDRIICKYVFGKFQVHLFVCWIGSHAAYDKLCIGNGQYVVSKF
jgi:mRNA interferase HigB